MNVRDIDGWILLDDWCKLADDTANACRQRVHQDYWQRGVHWSSPDGKVSYVHLERCKAWMVERGRWKGKV